MMSVRYFFWGSHPTPLRTGFVRLIDFVTDKQRVRFTVSVNRILCQLKRAWVIIPQGMISQGMVS